MHVHYAASDDVLYVAIDKPEPAVCDEDAHGILWRISYDGGRLCGATVIGFSECDNVIVLDRIAERLQFDIDALRQAIDCQKQ